MPGVTRTVTTGRWSIKPPAPRRQRHAAGTRWRSADGCGILGAMIELQVLTPDDWGVWRAQRLAALAEAPAAFGSRLADWQGEGDQEERWRARLSISGSHNVIAVLDGQPAGMVSGVPVAGGNVELISMWVSPQARGKGVGDRLTAAVEQWARQAGLKTLRLSVVENNEPAIALYQRNGLRLTDELGDLMPDGIRQERIMEKQLT
jgi:ribosomal protein S18 acetylase RimI-like enzyme